MEVISVGSSSSGNSYIIMTDEVTVLLDVGLPAKRIISALGELNRSPEDVTAVLITHEHSDHVKSVRAIGRQCKNAAFYASRGTVENSKNFEYIDEERIHFVSAGDTFFLPGMELSSFPLSHDAAEPLGFTFRDDDAKLAVVTDCGTVTDEVYGAIKDADVLVFEANHDEHLLMYGEYPYHLKLRIKSDEGHLSNRAAGEMLADLIKDRVQTAKDSLSVMLSHLSFHNNSPFEARKTVEGILKENGFEKDEHYYLTIASKDEMTFLP